MTDPSRGIREVIRELEGHVDAAGHGWPEELFLFVSRVTPLVNVDLLIRDDYGRTLLTWRSDAFYGPGWHIPGGIIRFKETAAERIAIVAERELGASVEFDRSPILVQETIVSERPERGHFISLLYKCRLTTDLDPRRRHSHEPPLPGHWGWHKDIPDNLIPEQLSYATYMR